MIPDLTKQNTIDVVQTYQETDAKLQTLRATNLVAFKPKLFEAMKQASIGHATVEFDDSGDSGSVVGIASTSIDGTILSDLPNFAVDHTTFRYDMAPVTPSDEDAEHNKNLVFRIIATTQPMALADVLEEIFWDLIGRRHGGWENEDGAYGECRFDAMDGTVTLEVNERYTDYHYHAYEF
jgi:hypothetical protein